MTKHIAALAQPWHSLGAATTSIQERDRVQNHAGSLKRQHWRVAHILHDKLLPDAQSSPEIRHEFPMVC
jgi:hypothetical protein